MGLNIALVATAALVVSLVALAISVYNALAGRTERLLGKRADLHVGYSTVELDGDDYRVLLRVTNVGRATASYLTASLVTPRAHQLCPPERAAEGLPPNKDLALTLQLPRASVPPQTPIVHAFLAWDDPSGYNHLKVSGHRVRLDQAQQRTTDAVPERSDSP